jgi:lactoylglutathione lyase
MAKAVHSMIRVLDEERSTAFYKTALGLTVADRIDFDTFTLIYLRNLETEFELELTVNKVRKDSYSTGDG